MVEKIILVSALNHNFGSVLQSYAFQHVLSERGADVKIIDYHKKLSFMQIIRVFNFALVEAKLRNIGKKIYTLSNSDRNEWDKRKNINYRNFIEHYISTTSVVKGYKSLRRFASDYDAIIVGSDQLWNPMNNGTHFATAEFAHENTARYSYATSFGVSELKGRDRKLMKKVLPLFRMISVREQQGAEIIKSILGSSVAVNVDLDPTLLIEGMEWVRLLKLNIARNDRKYIFAYFIGANEKYREIVSNMANANNLDIILMPHVEQYVRADMRFEKKEVCCAGPIEFLNYIYNAEFVVTDSFHGMVFSILFGKRFCVLDRFNKNDSRSMNSRIDNLLSVVGLADRHVDLETNVWDVLNREIDYDRVYHLLQGLRKKSLVYIDSVLEDIGGK